MNRRTLLLAGLVLLVAMTRLLPHPPNFTPLGALALFGGAQFKSRWAAFLVPRQINFEAVRELADEMVVGDDTPKHPHAAESAVVWHPDFDRRVAHRGGRPNGRLGRALGHGD